MALIELRAADGRFNTAVSAYLRADYDVALAATETITPVTAAVHLLRTDAHRRMGNLVEAIESARAAVAASSGEERVHAQAVLSGVQSMAGALDDAASTLARIQGRRLDFSKPLRAVIGYAHALAAYTRGNWQIADREIVEAYLDKDPISRARTLWLHAFLASAREDYLEQARLLSRSLMELGKASPTDIGMRASVLQALSACVRETPFELDLIELRSELRALSWTSHLVTPRFWAHRSVGLRLAFEGSIGVSLGLMFLRRSAEYAVTPAQKVYALLDTAYVSFSLGETYGATASLSEADELADAVDWGAERGDERVALVIAAELFATQNIERAHRYMQMYRQLPPLSSMMTLAHDRRLDGMVSHAEGVLARHSGRREEAVDRFGRALELFTAIRYNWRAAQAAIELHEITGRTEYRARAIELIRPYPNSWLAARIGGAGISLDPRYQLLTPSERKIFDLACEPCKRSEIAKRLGIAAKTVNTHLTAIYRKWGVHGHPELLAAVRMVSRLPAKAIFSPISQGSGA